jgi:myo-inositol 2-dehydrogenase / D-chiro-inositol 1-dehydrogenase
MEEQPRLTDRRIFLKNAASLAAVGALGSSLLLKSCSGDDKKVVAPAFLDKAPDGRLLRVGLIGCGGRGTGALFNFLNSGPNIEIVSLGDVFAERVNRCRQELKDQRNVEVADEKCFVGFDAFEKVIDAGVDVVVLAAPPYFRPQHFDAAVRARKHVFMEKPLAVDPVGTRSIMASGRMAEAAGLKVGCGTQRHHQRDYLTTYEHIKSGAIGEIVGANCYWNQGQLWYVNPQSGRSEMDNMLRDWVNWTWLSRRPYRGAAYAQY